MIQISTRRFRSLALAGAAALGLATVGSAVADPISSGSASASGVAVDAGGQEVVPPTPFVEASAAAGDASETVIDVPAGPVVVSGTLTGTATVHEVSDVDSALTVVAQATPGPYNATGVALVEGLDVLTGVVGAEVSLVSAAVVRAEAVAVCSAGGVTYEANSEIIDLSVGGNPVPLNDPVQDLVDQLGDLLEQTGLDAVVDVERNVITPLDDGISVTALVVTVLAAAGEEPLAEVRVAEATVAGVVCAPPVTAVPQNDVAEPPAPPQLPRTGASSALALLGGASLAAAALAIRRRFV